MVDGSALLDGTNGNTITNTGTMALVDGAPHPGGNFQGTFINNGTIQILSKGGSVGVNIPGGQTFTLTGSGSLTMGDGTATPTTISHTSAAPHSRTSNRPRDRNNPKSHQRQQQRNHQRKHFPGYEQPAASIGPRGRNHQHWNFEASNGGVLVIGSTTINNRRHHRDRRGEF